ncbi:MAG: hypothetical protein AB7I04_09345 [Pseudomonadales bacterium]
MPPTPSSTTDAAKGAARESADGCVAAALAAGPGAAPLAAQIAVSRDWRSPADVQRLSVRYACTGSPEMPVLEATVDGARFPLDAPVRLLPVVVSKPWGREIWFTGMEARGESMVSGNGGELGLGSYLALAPDRLCGYRPIVLLKILDPRADPVLGELYLELHEEKREVYVVTAVHPAAWPDGRGRIRYGVNQASRRAHGSDDAFRSAFLEALRTYRAVRDAVDAGADGLAAEERAALEATRAFTDERSLAPGDVISVPTRVPHSLQHGVRVVEFQTPTYERLIVSSTQRVLTQTGWDSERAVALMHLDTPPQPVPEPVAAGVDRIVAFEDFGVWRLRLPAGRVQSLPDHLPYAVAYCIEGRVQAGGRPAPLILSDDQAAFIPGSAVGQPLTALDDTLLLLAAPEL